LASKEIEIQKLKSEVRTLTEDNATLQQFIQDKVEGLCSRLQMVRDSLSRKIKDQPSVTYLTEAFKVKSEDCEALQRENRLFKEELEGVKMTFQRHIERMATEEVRLLADTEHFRGDLILFFNNSMFSTLFDKVNSLKQEITFKDNIIRKFRAAEGVFLELEGEGLEGPKGDGDKKGPGMVAKRGGERSTVAEDKASRFRKEPGPNSMAKGQALDKSLGSTRLKKNGKVTGKNLPKPINSITLK